ncbi:hypothetical protein [Nocardia cyriacigeorgica]|uniref:hypothetical protein n=1 Tax=Nocardia cyriacigeorgica TaxID=135487 RepID=UPI003CC8030D
MGVASGEAGVSIGDGIVLRFVLWVVLTAVAVVFVIRYARRVQQDRARSLVGFGSDEDEADTAGTETPEDERRLTGTQKWVLAITAFTFGLMIFSVIPWSAIFGATTTPADYDVYHETATEPYWFELNWWFPQLAMLFIIAAIVVGVVARMGEKEIVSLITRGAGDMVGPAIVILLARGVSVIMTNTQTLDTVLNAMEELVSGASAGVFAVLVMIVNIPLAILIPSSSGHATLAMPLLAPARRFRRGEPFAGDHGLPDGARADHADRADQRCGRRWSGDGQGRLRQIPALHLALDADQLRHRVRGDRRCGAAGVIRGWTTT